MLKKSDKNMTTVVHASGRPASVGSNTCTDQVTRGRSHVRPIDTETLTREPFKDGSLHNTHWTPTNHGDGEFDGIPHTGDNTFPHSCLPNRKKFEAWHMLHDSGGGHLTSEDVKVLNSVYLCDQSNLASGTRKSYRMDVGGQKLTRITHLDHATILPIPTSRKFNGHVRYKTEMSTVLAPLSGLRPGGPNQLS